MNCDTVPDAVRALRQFQPRKPLAILPLSVGNLRDLEMFFSGPGSEDIQFFYLENSVHGSVLVLFNRGSVSFLDVFERAGGLCMN